MKQILLIDQEFGAGASTIGEKIAERLNWKFFDQALTEEIARLAKIPVEVCQRRLERNDPVLQRLVNVIWRGSFDRNLPSPDLAILDTDRLASLVQQVIEQAAEKKPCVIVGRGAPYFLRNRTDTFSRVSVCLARSEISPSAQARGQRRGGRRFGGHHGRGSPEVRETLLRPRMAEPPALPCHAQHRHR